MSKPETFLLYEVTRTKEAYPSLEPLNLGIDPKLNPRWLPWLKTLHPYFEDELWFEVGDTEVVPLTEFLARDLSNQKWRVELRGNGQPRNEWERKLLTVCKERYEEVEGLRNEVLSYTNPYGDYIRAGLVGRYLRTSEVGDDLERLKASGLVAEEESGLARIVAQLVEWKAELEEKGWQFKSDGTVKEPSTGGAPPRYPSSVIRAHFRQLEGTYRMSGSSTDFVERIREDLEPVFGELSPTWVREVLKLERKQRPGKRPRRSATARA